MELLGRLAQGSVVLLNEVPTDLVLGEVFGPGIGVGVCCLSSSRVLLVVDAVGGHDCSTSRWICGCRRANLKLGAKKGKRKTRAGKIPTSPKGRAEGKGDGSSWKGGCQHLRAITTTWRYGGRDVAQ